MKYIKYFKYALSAAMILCLLSGLTSCGDDIALMGEGGKSCNTVSLKIQLPEPTVVNPMTRAQAADFDKVNDLNILVCDGDEVKQCIYLDGTKLPQDLPEGQESVVTENGGITITSKKNSYGYMEYTVDFALDFWAELGVTPSNCQFYAVANHGSEITEKSLDAVKSMQVNEILSDGHSFVPTQNVMFGEGVSGEPEADPNDPSIRIRTITIGLKRTVAMITLQIDGQNLNPDVVISIESVALRNVPKSCCLGKTNTPTDHEQISENGDFKGGVIFSGGYKLIGNDQSLRPGYSETDYYKTVIGGHYPENADKTVSNVTGTFVQPMFMFENSQPDGVCGGGDKGSDQVHKRPSSSVDATEAAIAKYNETGVCSYIEVTGTYTKLKAGSADTESRGPATWRFFLGKNPETDFNVERNANYRITLNLSGSGIGEANYSWRVDTQLETPEVVGNPNMVVGGGGEMFCVEFIKDPGDHPNMKVLYEYKENGVPSGNKDFVYAFMSHSGNTDIRSFSWQGASVPDKSAYFWYLTADKQLWFYVSPLMPADENDKNEDEPGVTERWCKITFVDTNDKNAEHPYGTVTFTQYKPVRFSIKQEDLKNYPNDKDLQKAAYFVKEYYKHDVETQGDFVFWADRVDRDPMPWGFSGVRMDKNQNTGFENVYHLVKPKDENYKEESCPLHIAYAGHYLPTGKGFREEKAGTNPIEYETYIDYSNGSCMMHAAMENHFQQYHPKPADNITPDDMLNIKVSELVRPGEGDGLTTDRRFSWCVPSIVGCQLVEVLDRFYKNHDITDRGFDPKYPIKKWVSYWTSNAATLDLKETYSELNITGLHRSFTYQFGMGFDQIGQGQKYPAQLVLPRAAATKYRLLNIRPDNLK